MHLALICCLFLLVLFESIPTFATAIICIAIVLVVLVLLLHSKLVGIEKKIDSWITTERGSLEADLFRAKGEAAAVAKKL
jgi:hypothetical protein